MAEKRPGFYGIIPALITPFKNGAAPDGGGGIDTGALRAIVNFVIEAGGHGLFPCGINGEGILMNVAERKIVGETVIDVAAGRVP